MEEQLSLEQEGKVVEVPRRRGSANSARNGRAKEMCCAQSLALYGRLKGKALVRGTVKSDRCCLKDCGSAQASLPPSDQVGSSLTECRFQICVRVLQVKVLAP